MKTEVKRIFEVLKKQPKFTNVRLSRVYESKHINLLAVHYIFKGEKYSLYFRQLPYQSLLYDIDLIHRPTKSYLAQWGGEEFGVRRLKEYHEKLEMLLEKL